MPKYDHCALTFLSMHGASTMTFISAWGMHGCMHESAWVWIRACTGASAGHAYNACKSVQGSKGKPFLGTSWQGCISRRMGCFQPKYVDVNDMFLSNLKTQTCQRRTVSASCAICGRGLAIVIAWMTYFPPSNPNIPAARCSMARLAHAPFLSRPICMSEHGGVHAVYNLSLGKRKWL